MAKSVAQLKDDVQKLLNKGKDEKAYDLAKEILKKEPKDPSNLKRVADIANRLRHDDDALKAYQKLAESYREKGFEIKAVAIAKIMLEIDPACEYAVEMLGEAHVAPAPAAQTPAAPKSAMSAKAQEISDEEKQARAQTLNGNILFSGFAADELGKVISKLKIASYQAEEWICRDGDPGDSIHLVANGRVGIFKSEKDGGEEKLIVEIREGNFYGEFGFFGDLKRHASVRALTDADILVISKGDFEEIMQELPRVSEVLVGIYKQRVLDLILATSSLFGMLTPEDRELLLGKFELGVFPEGTTVIAEGDAGDYMYLIKDGKVKVQTTGPDGDKIDLAVLAEGDFFGEGSLITGKPRTADVIALEELRVMKLSAKNFQDIAGRYPEIKEKAEAVVETRAQETIDLLMNAMQIEDIGRAV